ALSRSQRSCTSFFYSVINESGKHLNYAFWRSAFKYVSDFFRPSLFAEPVCDLTAIAKQDHVCVVFLYSGPEIRGKRSLVAMKLVEACVHPANVVPCENNDHGRLCKPSQCKALQHLCKPAQRKALQHFAKCR
ncbi:unnamed protein product, partial [Polarella glacialis]